MIDYQTSIARQLDRLVRQQLTASTATQVRGTQTPKDPFGAEADEYETQGWRVSEFEVREVGGDNYLATYLLHQPGRVTRRLTVWQGWVERGWMALSHQGTVVSER